MVGLKFYLLFEHNLIIFILSDRQGETWEWQNFVKKTRVTRPEQTATWPAFVFSDWEDYLAQGTHDPAAILTTFMEYAMLQIEIDVDSESNTSAEPDHSKEELGTNEDIAKDIKELKVSDCKALAPSTPQISKWPGNGVNYPFCKFSDS